MRFPARKTLDFEINGKQELEIYSSKSKYHELQQIRMIASRKKPMIFFTLREQNQ